MRTAILTDDFLIDFMNQFPALRERDIVLAMCLALGFQVMRDIIGAPVLVQAAPEDLTEDLTRIFAGILRPCD